MVSKKAVPAAKNVGLKKAAAKRAPTAPLKNVVRKNVATNALATKPVPVPTAAAKKAIVRVAFNENRNERGTDQFVRNRRGPSDVSPNDAY